MAVQFKDFSTLKRGKKANYCLKMLLNIKFILKQGIKQFHEKFVLAPADKAGNSAIIVCQLQYIYTIISELSTAKTYELILQIYKNPVAKKHSNDILLSLQ